MNIHIASDHAGLELKSKVIQSINDKKIIIKNQLNQSIYITDHGPFNSESVDYPDFADLVCQKLKSNPNDFGILICGSGQGMALRANKYQHIRAALIYNDEIAKLSREHNNSNVICIGSRFCNESDAQNWINIFLNTHFAEGRHTLRVAKISHPIS